MCACTLERLKGFCPDRRGSAWGLAGLVKGMGIGSLKNFGILDRIKEATEDQVSLHCLTSKACLSSGLCLTCLALH